MNIFWEELTAGIPDVRQLTQVLIRLTSAIILGAVIGLQRERAGKPAGIRTHILATLGTTVFILGCKAYGMDSDALSRVIQGIITGIGFLGAGAILKLDEKRDIKGLTTAAGVWLASAIGVAVGLGALGLAIIATALALLILKIYDPLEMNYQKSAAANPIETQAKSGERNE